MDILELLELKKSFLSPDACLRPVIDIQRFNLPAGAQTAVMGESGLGKTTLLNLISGILAADAGQILVGGRDMAKLSEAGRDKCRGRSIGYIHQTFNLLQGFSAIENVLLAMAFGRGMDPPRARALLDRVGLRDRLNDRPRQLSSGQQQRVAIARALANQPSLVLADEPTGHLDPANAREALALIREVCAETGAALLLVTHDREILAGFESVVSLAAMNRAMDSAKSA
ncbi:MAG: ABC transporter ATP-binding protein [Candidatus Lindowbacteria bacterium RIFCSPLOWO2_12_FULL_62_27]|nr:MAG: ABC transporter ATP-binding protein [Candidatus Lindowbacteria bacterium RIFCSPLOWO2_02_FULL_62_12]OGH62992.1 MAG: ABC transporter ATP-binding protein [Candidatus Lindowbacteria bacterium RIFCSPLOWO2_12_FULL_62_27]